jgi:hypothetical protein
MRTVTIKLCALVLATLAIVSCKQEQLPLYEDVNRVYFYWAVAPLSTDQVNYKMVSLGYDIPMKADSTIAVRVRTMGRLSDVDREVKAEVIAAESTAKVGEDIEIVGGKVAAGARDGYVYVKIKNTEKLLTNTLRARIRLVPNENFHVDWNGSSAVGNNTSGIEYYLVFDAITDMPNLWKDAPMMNSYFGPWSRVKETIIYEALGFDRSFFTYDPSTENAVDVLSARIPNFLSMSMVATVNRWLRDYKDAHDGQPLLDENGVEVKTAIGGLI